MSFWSEDRISYLRAQAPHRSASQIAAELGCTRNAVIGKCGRLGVALGKPAPEPLPVPSSLPPSRPPAPAISAHPLRGRYAETRPSFFHARCDNCAELSDELNWGAKGFKRAAELLRRIGWRLSGMGYGARWTCAACNGSPIPRASLPSPIVVRSAPASAIVCEPVNPKEIWELGDCECVWPIGDPMSEDFRYCANPKSDKRYCATHAAISRGAGTPSERVAHKPKRSFYR